MMIHAGADVMEGEKGDGAEGATTISPIEPVDSFYNYI